MRAPKSAPLVGWARPDYADFADGICSTGIRYLGEFTEAKRGKPSGSVDRDQVEVGLVGWGLVIVKPHADPVKYRPVQVLVLLQLFFPMHAPAQDKACC